MTIRVIKKLCIKAFTILVGAIIVVIPTIILIYIGRLGHKLFDLDDYSHLMSMPRVIEYIVHLFFGAFFLGAPTVGVVLVIFLFNMIGKWAFNKVIK